MARLFAALLNTSAQAALAAWSSLFGNNQHSRALGAVALQTLNDDDLELFESIAAAIRGITRQRNKLAHCHWGVSSDLPDALLLISPSQYIELIGHATDAIQHEQKPDIRKLRIDPKNIYVYFESDFAQLHRDITILHKTLYDFVGLIQREPSPSRSELADELRQRPLVRQHTSEDRNPPEDRE